MANEGLSGAEIAGGQIMRSFDLGLVRDSANQRRADAEMIASLCDTVFGLTKENQDLKARLAKLEPVATAGPGPGK